MRALSAIPVVRVSLAGAPLAPLDALSSVWVSQDLSAPAQCELCFQEPRDRLLHEVQAHLDARLEVTLEGSPVPLFTGSVTAIEHVHGESGGAEVYVRGYDALHALRREQPMRRHRSLSVEELARELVRGIGLEVRASEPGPVRREDVQHDESNLAFLDRVARRAGLYLTLRGETLHLVSLEGTGEAIELELGKSLFGARVEVNAEAPRPAVSGHGWSPADAGIQLGEAETPSAGVGGPAVPATHGPQALTDLVAEDAVQVGALARAELDRRVAHGAVLNGTAEGDARLRPATRIRVVGLADPLCADYVLTSVRHRIDAERGFVSELSTAPPAPIARAHAAVVGLGLVTRVDDPRGLGRVCAALPAYGDTETGWMPVACPAAGADKGFVSLPDVGDRVLVAMPHGDPAQGIVIGGLYGEEAPPESPVEGESIGRHAWRTPRGQRVVLDDVSRSARIHAGSLRFQDGAGSHLELHEDGVTLHAECDLEIAAPGKRIVVRAARVDFEEA